MKLLVDYQYIGTVNYYKMLFNFAYIEFEEYDYYQKGKIRNRMVIPGANGLISLSVPLENGRNQKCLFKEVNIAYKDNWVVQHTRALDACYMRAPFYEFYRDELLAIYQKKHLRLMELNKELVLWVLKKLKCKAVVTFNQSYQTAPDNTIFDGRNQYLPNQKNHGLESLKYDQVFEDRIGFQPNMCMLDLLFCMGPSAVGLLKDNESRF